MRVVKGRTVDRSPSRRSDSAGGARPYVSTTVVRGLRCACFAVTKRPEIAERARPPEERDDFVLSTTVVRPLRAACTFDTNRPLIAERARVPDRLPPRATAGPPVDSTFWAARAHTLVGDELHWCWLRPRRRERLKRVQTGRSEARAIHVG